ncbi:MAG: c-type cytochrome [Polyangiaceae bacterium]|nr:c-type cytochrome [Polyangiaceae bacterium]
MAVAPASASPGSREVTARAPRVGPVGGLGLAVVAAAVAVGSCGRKEAPGGSSGVASSASAAASVSAAAPVAATAKRPPAPPGDAERGKKLAQEHECHRCHDGAGLTAAPREKHCFHCHQQIVTGEFPAPKHALAKWRPNVAPVQDVPTLEGAGRFDRSWLFAFLQEPHDLRPALAPTMPRLAIDAAEAADLTSWLTRDATSVEAVSLEGASLERGRELLEQRACGICHELGGAPLPQRPGFTGSETQRKAATLAPDLRLTRERWEAAPLVAWIQDPKRLKPDTLMPSMGLKRDEARDVAAYLLRAPLAPAAPRPVPPRLPLLERRVTFAEVDTAVFTKICRHCHGNEDAELGDGGPGNTGGFGFSPRKLDLASYAGIAAGLLDTKGERASVFAKLDDGTPRLVAVLLARQKEEAGRPDPRARGMPLGLPSLTPEQIQLVETWVSQGRPR